MHGLMRLYITVEGKHGNTYTRDVSVAKKVIQPLNTLQPNPQRNDIPLEPKPIVSNNSEANIKVYPKRNKTPVVRYITVKRILLKEEDGVVL